MSAVLYIPAVRIFEAFRFFKAITGYLHLSPLRNTSALYRWAHLIGLKKEVAYRIKL